MNEEVKRQVLQLILRRGNVDKVVVFGSRARKDAKPYSDIDIAVFAKKWSRSDCNIVKSELDEDVHTALKFDLIHFDELPEGRFKDRIIKEGEVIYDSRTNQ